jgi:YHS domain-containing protein
MQVEKVHAPASRLHAGERQYFCSDHCAQRFDAPEDGTGHPTEGGEHRHGSGARH